MEAAMNHSAAATAYEPSPSRQGEASAEDRIVPRHVPSSDRLAGDQAPEEGQSRAEAYQDQGLRALAYLDHIGTAVSAATSTLRWNSHDAAAVSAAMSSIRANLDAAQAAIDVRADIVAAEAAPLEPKPAPAPEPQLEPAADPAPAAPSSPIPAEGSLVAATRAAEAVRSHAEQLLMGFQFAPREAAMIFGGLHVLLEHAEAAQSHYLDFALAQDAEASGGLAAWECSSDVMADEATSDAGEQSAAGQDESEAGADQQGAPAGQGIPSVQAALNEARQVSLQAGIDAGRAVLARSSEAHRFHAVGTLEAAIAHASLVLAGLKWDPENAVGITASLAQAARCFIEAEQAVTARIHLSGLDAAAASHLPASA